MSHFWPPAPPAGRQQPFLASPPRPSVEWNKSVAFRRAVSRQLQESLEIASVAAQGLQVKVVEALAELLSSNHPATVLKACVVALQMSASARTYTVDSGADDFGFDAALASFGVGKAEGF